MSQYAKLRNDLSVSEAEIENQKVYNIKDPITENFFRLREPEYWLISQLDGKTSPETIASKFTEKYKMNMSAEAVAGFIQALEANFFLENARSEQQTSRKSYGSGSSSYFNSIFFIKIKSFDPTRLLNLLYKLYKPFNNPIGYLLQILLILTGFALFLSNSSSFTISISSLFNIGSILSIVLAFFIVVTIHEFSHALACKIYGGEVKEIGFLLMYFQPCCYCNISDAWLIPQKRKRLMVTWAGLYSGLILMGLSMLVWRVTIETSFVNQLTELVVLIILVTILFNFNPLIKLDGYYLLSDWLEIPNLRSKAFSFAGYVIKNKILGWDEPEIKTSGREKLIYTIYSILAVIYTVLLIGYVVYVLGDFVADKFGIRGLALFILLIFYTLRRNIFSVFNGIIKHLTMLRKIMKKPVRFTLQVVVVITLIVLMFFIPFPHRVTGEITVRPIAEFSLLINDLGLMEKKLEKGGTMAEIKTNFVQMTSIDLGSLNINSMIRDGQKVNALDTIAVLVSNQVQSEIESEQSYLKKLENDYALLKSPPKAEEVLEAEAEVNSAKAVYEKNLKEEKRVEKLLKLNSSTEQEYERIFADVAVSKAEWENKVAKLKLIKSGPKPEEEAVILSQIEEQKSKIDFLLSQKEAQSIITPISGKISISNESKELMSVIDQSVVEVLVPVSDFDIDLVWLKQEVKVKVRSYLDKVFKGEVVHVPQDAILKDGESFFMVSALIENIDGELQKGMTGYAKIEIGKTSLFNLLLRRLSSIIRVEFWSLW